MVANSAPHLWHELPKLAVSLIQAAYGAYCLIGGGDGRLTEKWTPEFNGAKVCPGALPIDLGGIGKGFSVT